MIIVLTGPDTYRSRQRLHFYIEGYKKKYDPAGHTLTQLAGETLTVDKMKQALGGNSLLAKKRLIVIDRLQKNRSKTVASDVYKLLEQSGLEDIVLLFWDETTVPAGGRRTKSGGALRMPEAKVEVFDEMLAPEKSRWVITETKKRGGTITPEALDELLRLTAGNLWQLSSEIDKLISYAAGRPIGLADVQALVTGQVSSNIFPLLDAVSERQAARATALLSDELASGSSPQYVVSMLLRHLRLLVEVRDNMERNAAGTAPTGVHPFVFRKASQQAKQFTGANLKQLYLHLAGLDETMKTGSEDPLALLQLFVLEATGAAA